MWMLKNYISEIVSFILLYCYYYLFGPLTPVASVIFRKRCAFASGYMMVFLLDAVMHSVFPFTFSHFYFFFFLAVACGLWNIRSLTRD